MLVFIPIGIKAGSQGIAKLYFFIPYSVLT